MEAWKFVNTAKATVVNHVNAHVSDLIVDMDDIDIIWMHQTEHTSRAILTVIPPNGMLYEVTYSREKREARLDVYIKSSESNVVKL